MKNYISGGIEFDWKTGLPVEKHTVYDQSSQVKVISPEIQASINGAAENARRNNLVTKGQASAKTQRRGGILRYPLEALTGSTDYLQINIIEYKRQPNQFTRPAGFGANTLSGTVGGTSSGSLARRSVINDGSILLQVPSNVQDGNAVNFGDSSMNTLIGAAAGVVGNVMGAGGQAVADVVEGKRTLSQGLGDFGKDVKDSYLKLRNLEIKEFNQKEIFDKTKSITKWERDNTLDC